MNNISSRRKSPAFDGPLGDLQPFPASYDATTKIISAVLLLIIVVVLAVIRSPILASLGVVVVTLTYAYSPRGYTLQQKSIVVKRLAGDVRIPLDCIRQVRWATTDDFRGTLRLWGSSGFFGYYGEFRMYKLGKATWYVTNPSNAILVVTDRKTALFSPDDVDRFVRALRASAPDADVAPRGPDARASHHSGSITRLVGLAIGVAVALATLAEHC